jgi:oligopeptide transport system substrate-binding protein
VPAPRLSPLVLCALAALGCGSKGDESPYFGTVERAGVDVHTLRMNNLGEPEYLDPGKANDTISSKAINHLFEGLATYGPDAEPTAGVAVRYDKSNDNRFYRFYLREDARWSDGKPVTAHDFEYAFKRVLDPKTASQSAPNLYAVKNGELVNQGRLKVTSAEVAVRAAPSGGETARLPAGTPVVVLGISPVVVDSAFAPFASVPEGVEGFSYDKADPASGAEERLLILRAKESKVAVPDEAKRLPKGDYDLVRRLGPVVCNGEADHYFEIASASGAGGILPGCMLAPSKREGRAALVARHDDVPTFVARPLPDEPPEPQALGFVDEASLASDTSVIGVRAVGDHVLELELAYATPYLLDLLCHAASFPVRKDVVERFPDDPDRWTRLENIVSNGPYRLSGWKFRYEIRMTRSPHHRFYDKLKIRDIVWTVVESTVSSMNLYKSGELDYLGDNGVVSPNYIPHLKRKKDLEQANWLGTYWYELNTKQPPLDNADVRRALNLAIDKRELVEKVVLGGQRPATHFVPDFTGGGYDVAAKADADRGADPFSGDGAVFDPALARQLLGRAGFRVVAEGDGYRAEGMPPIELLYNTNEGHKKVAVAIQDMFKRHLGVSVTLRNEEWKVMLKNVRDRNFQIVRFGWIADFDHPQTFLDTFMSKSPNNRTGWSSAEFDALVKKARATADVAESMRIYRQAERILVDEAPKIPLYFYTKTTLIKPYVKGHHFNRRNEQLAQWMWIDPAWRTNASDEPAFEPEPFPAPGEY